ncbi:protein of unknown function DUF2325 [Syntrophotalea carbinolica DSM 2380]|uniref:Dihydroorotate dehydrogenase n=1 Tax=Syntrophotalea carbinolica (strain DSM 2380 / NBRC 103641 / GraBd1) TaxID=338963 RepID=Q3A4X1_SYNC1|nr:DUF2325 domain-containing protein [Syntrophotalea carbinolica]ABA88586.1 protein of unknown function DUF2325 [Syntrophotalea carbinolica DSM 2380]
MSLLIIGADRINALIPRLEEIGATRITHWPARNSKTAKNTIPRHVDAVLFFTDFLHHTAARKIKSQVKQLGIPAIYSRRNWSELAEQMQRLPR